MFPEPLRALVSRKFLQARTNKDIIFSETQLALLPVSYKTPIQLRYCPALAKKPVKENQPEDKGKAKPFDPFEDPSPQLLVAEIPTGRESHNIILNKYPVIPNHFILATKDNKPQTDLLEEDDLSLAQACLRAWEEDNHSLFAFFNSGEHSGASQPHRHLQFLPVEDMARDCEDGWVPLCDTMNTPINEFPTLLHNPELPFVHFAVSLEDNPGPAEILYRYKVLLKAGIAGMSDDPSLKSLDDAKIEHQGRTTFSYNLAMTTKLMAILPRSQEAWVIPEVPGGSVAINGTILAGTMMVKLEQEWSHLRKNPQVVEQMLRSISFSPTGRVFRQESL